MATYLRIYYHSATADGDTPLVKKIQVLANKQIYIKRDLGGDQFLLLNFDFRNSREGIGSSPNGVLDGLYEYEVVGDDLYVKIAVKLPADTDIPQPNTPFLQVTSFPEVVFTATGETATFDMPTDTVPWIPGATFTYPEKQAIAVQAIKDMLLKKEEDIELASRYLDLNSDIPKHIAYWWRAAVCVVKGFFQNSDVDPLIVAEMAKQAAAGPTTRGDQITLLRNLTVLIGRFPTGPPFAAIWVETRNLNSPSDVRRKTILQVLETIGTAEDETFPLPASFDSTDESWIVENQPGIVSYDDGSPSSGDTVTASLVDYDGRVFGESWQWQAQQGSNWVDVASETANAYSNMPSGAYRVKVTYTDNYGSGNIAFGETLTIA